LDFPGVIFLLLNVFGFVACPTLTELYLVLKTET